MKNKVVGLRNISFSNYSTKILDGVDLDIEQNSLTTIIGKSGCGKSTLLKLMAGIILPTDGKLLLFDSNYYEASELIKRSIRKKISFVFQNSALIANLSISENLLLPLNFHYPEMPRKEQIELVEKHLEMVGMLKSMNGRPAQLSMGEQKLVGIARALVTKPEILFLDEPFGSLDAVITEKLMDAVYKYSSLDWTTIVMVSYSKDILLGLSNKIIYLNNNKIEFNLPTTEVLSREEENIPMVIRKALETYSFM